MTTVSKIVIFCLSLELCEKKELWFKSFWNIIYFLREKQMYKGIYLKNFVVTMTTVYIIIILCFYCSESGVHVDNGNIERVIYNTIS